MKLLIAGSRGIEGFDLSDYVPSETEIIISGGAKGIDAVAEKYADDHGIKKIIIKPDYATKKNKALRVVLVDEE